MNSSNFLKTILICVLFNTSLFALNETDSLKLEIQKAKARLESIQEETEESKQYKMMNIDTVQRALETISRFIDETEDLYDNLQDDNFVMENRQKSTDPNRMGGGGGLYLGIRAVDVSPIKKMIRKDLALKGSESIYYGMDLENRIEGTYETMITANASGAVHIGDGVHFGLSFSAGSHPYRVEKGSESYTFSTYYAYGAAIAEKRFTKNKHNIVVGALLGVGALGASLHNDDDDDYYDNNYFYDNDYYDDKDDENDDAAIVLCNDIHSSYTYSVRSWLHVGVQLSALTFYSQAGLKHTDEFFTVNPGGELKIMFGKRVG